MTTAFPPHSRERAIFCNRTLNLRAISAIGYDMDYTLVQYDAVEWEKLAYGYATHSLRQQGWPVDELVFDPDMMIQGLIIDTRDGNLLKVNRFGYVKTGFHGTKPIAFEEQRRLYGRTIVDHREPRFVFLSTLFSVSEACLFAQLVDLWDAGELPAVPDYYDLYRRTRQTIDEQHRGGKLKAEIATDFDRFVQRDPDLCTALLDQCDAGKKLLLITNSDWPYTRDMMAFALDPYLPGGMTWRDLFDLIIVSAHKPDFFSSRSPLLEVVDESGLLKPAQDGPASGRVYFGGNASIVEEYLGLSGQQILYVGDHFFGDVHATKSTLRWRTALIVRELEAELVAAAAFEQPQAELARLMAEKEDLEARYCHVRLGLQRQRKGRRRHGEQPTSELKRDLENLRGLLAKLDDRIAPLAGTASRLGNENWGPIMRAGNDKSYIAHLVERHADIYTSRVSNLLSETPFAYFRSPRGTLPHDFDRG
ncbi:HAD-IG family 5'-nucleotidase [Myxococcota bacterium]